MGIQGNPKNKKRSIHLKYKRRLRSLAHALEDFLLHAEDKLDRSKSGAIQHRKFIEEVVEKAQELSDMLPPPEEIFPYPKGLDLEKALGVQPTSGSGEAEEHLVTNSALQEILEMSPEELQRVFGKSSKK